MRNWRINTEKSENTENRKGMKNFLAM